METINIEKIYSDFYWPTEFKKVMELDLVDFEQWYMMNKENVETRIQGLQKRYPLRKLIPFARRDDSDDIACFEVGKGNKVQIIHDFASAGWEQRKEYPDFWTWFREAIEEMIESEYED